MAHSGQRSFGRVAGVARSLADAGRRLGTALLGAAVPALVAIAGAALVADEAAEGPVAWVDAAMETSVTGGQGLQWAFHVAALVGVVGLAVLAAALVVEGYFDLE